MDPARHLRQMVNGYQVSQALHVAAMLGLSDLLAEGPRSVADLARATETHPPTLARLMRALASVGVYEPDAEGRFTNTELGELLRTDVPGSLGGWAGYVGRPAHWEAWANLGDSVRTGENAFLSVHARSVWDYRREHPEDGLAFDRGMTSLSLAVAQTVAEVYDFGRFRTVVDVGGGHGVLLAAILERHPDVHGVVFDQPEVIATAGEPVGEDPRLASRLTMQGGSFFEAVPGGADAYLMKAVIHDWADPQAVDILRVCRRAVPDHGVLLLIEQLLGEGPEPARTSFSDLNMLVGPGGQERTRDEYRGLLEAAGFSLVAATGTGTAIFVIEAVPV